MKIRILLFCSLILFIMTGCPEIPTVVHVSTDKDGPTCYSSEGGCDTVTMLADYDEWYISSVITYKVRYVYNDKFGCEQRCDYETKRYLFNLEKDHNTVGWEPLLDSKRFETEWFCIYIPEDNPKSVVVDCFRNDDEYDREIEVYLDSDEFGEDETADLYYKVEGTYDKHQAE